MLQPWTILGELCSTEAGCPPHSLLQLLLRSQDPARANCLPVHTTLPGHAQPRTFILTFKSVSFDRKLVALQPLPSVNQPDIASFPLQQEALQPGMSVLAGLEKRDQIGVELCVAAPSQVPATGMAAAGLVSALQGVCMQAGDRSRPNNECTEAAADEELGEGELPPE